MWSDQQSEVDEGPYLGSSAQRSNTVKRHSNGQHLGDGTVVGRGFVRTQESVTRRQYHPNNSISLILYVIFTQMSLCMSADNDSTMCCIMNWKYNDFFASFAFRVVNMLSGKVTSIRIRFYIILSFYTLYLLIAIPTEHCLHQPFT